jgi:hypothetical protein
MAVEIGALRALLSLDSAAFERGAKRAQASMGKLQRSLTVAGSNMAKTGRKLTSRLTLPMAALGGVTLRSSLMTIDAQSKMAQSLGTSTKSMQVLARAADRAGISTGELEQIARQLTKRLSQAVAGTGPAVKALDRLGLSAEELSKMDLDKRITAINTAIAEVVPVAEQAAVAATIFGDRAGLLASRLDPETMAAATAEIERFGLAVTEIEADQIEEANDAMSALSLVVQGLGNQMAVALAPTLKRVAEALANAGEWFSKLSPEMQTFIGTVAAAAAALGPLGVALGLIVTALGAISAPVLAVIAGLAALGAAVAAAVIYWDDITAAVNRAVDAILGFGPMVVNALKDIANQALEAAKEIGTQLIEGIKAGIAERWDAFKAGLVSRFDGLVTDIKSFLGIQSPSRVFMEIGDFIMQGAAIGIENGAQGAVDAAQAAGKAISDGFGQAANASPLDQVRDKVDSIADSLGRAIVEGESLRETFADILSSGASSLLSTGLKGLGAAIGIPGFATGTNFAPGGLAVVGEQGPELVNLPRGSKVFNANKTAQMMQGGGGVSISIDARGAQAGVAEQVRSELVKVMPEIERRSVVAMDRARKRGHTA